MTVSVGWVENLVLAQEILGGKVSCEEEFVRKEDSLMACRRRKSFLCKDTRRGKKVVEQITRTAALADRDTI